MSGQRARSARSRARAAAEAARAGWDGPAAQELGAPPLPWEEPHPSWEAEPTVPPAPPVPPWLGPPALSRWTGPVRPALAGGSWEPVEAAEQVLDVQYAGLEAIAAGESRLMAARAQQLLQIQAQARRADQARGNAVSVDFLDLHLAGTLVQTQQDCRTELREATHLVHRLPGTLQALADGWLRVAQARAIVHLTDALSAEQCAVIEALVLPTCPGRQVASLRRRLRTLRMRLQDPQQAEAERQDALAARGVSSSNIELGMAQIVATVPAGAAPRFMDALRELAERAEQPGDTRTAQQRMSDVLAALPELVLAAAVHRPGQPSQDGEFAPELLDALADALTEAGLRTGGTHAPVQALLLVPAATALGGNEPAELLGYGPISATHARELLERAEIRTGTVDPTSGRLVAIDTALIDLRPHTQHDTERDCAAIRDTTTGADDDAGDGTHDAARSAGDNPADTAFDGTADDRPAGDSPADDAAGDTAQDRGGDAAGSPPSWQTAVRDHLVRQFGADLIDSLTRRHASSSSPDHPDGPDADESPPPHTEPNSGPALTDDRAASTIATPPAAAPRAGAAPPSTATPSPPRPGARQPTGSPQPPAPPPAEPQHDPSDAMRRFLRLRDRTCVGPGCHVPARRCDLEHRIPWPQGPTSPANVSPVSRHCHRAKQAGWRYTRHPDGSTTWHPADSRRTYTVPAEPVLWF
jgi:hypothetical protein